MNKSKWYLTKLIDPLGRRAVLMAYGSFTSSAKADAITWQPSPLGESLMERKPEFSGVGILPVKGGRIIAHPNLFIE